MIRLIAFCLGSAFFIYVSRNSLFRRHSQGFSHGFYRFFAWELMFVLFLFNVPVWHEHPFSFFQIISWCFLAISIFLVAHGVYLLKFAGRPTPARTDPHLFAFEKTSALVTVGIYKYIRHPLYSSLLFLTWGIFFKNPS
jgi:protein-S-isoprenylcysteine O-methyltransferase Ste14